MLHKKTKGGNHLTEKIMYLLKHKDPEVRRQTLHDLRKQMDVYSTVPFLIKSLEDDNWRVRKTAVEILLDIRGESVIRELIKALYQENANARNSSIETLVELGPEATDFLVHEFKNTNTDVKKFIIDILGSTKDLKAFPLLLKSLEHEDENIKAAVVEYLGNIQRNDTVLEALITVLKSEDIWVAYHAAVALGRLKDARSVDALMSVLSKKELRKPVIRALGYIADVTSLSSLVPFLNDKSNTVREEALKAIAQFIKNDISGEIIVESFNRVFGDKTSELVVPYAKNSNEELRTSALLLLGLLNDRDVIAPLLELSVSEEFTKPAVDVLVFMGNSIPEALIPFFSTEDTFQRRTICEVAGRICSDIFLRPLLSSLQDKDGHVRGNAAFALSNLGKPEAVRAIMPLMLDEYENIQEHAITSLSKLKKWVPLDEIIKGLSDENPTLRRNSALLLGMLGEQRAIEPLGTALKDSNIRVRKAVVEALAAIGNPYTIKFLLLALTDEVPEICRLAAISLGKLHAKESLEPLTMLLFDKNALIRSTAAEALGNIGSNKAVEPLLRLLTDDSGFVKTAAIESLGNFREERVKNALVLLLNDKDAEIRSAVVESLGNFEDVIKDIVPLLHDKEWYVRKKVVDVLGKSFKQEGYPYLKEIAKTDEDFQVRETAEVYLHE
jgi:HEAT repeat protein